jgi:hypothetical protein
MSVSNVQAAFAETESDRKPSFGPCLAQEGCYAGAPRASRASKALRRLLAVSKSEVLP